MQIIKAKVEKLLITQPNGQAPIETDKIRLFLAGIQHDRHFGRNNLSDVRTKKLLPKGFEVANLRAVTLVSLEELKSVSKEIGFEIMPEDLQANITLSGYKGVTKLPPGTFIKFPQNAILYVTAENLPCVVPAQAMIARGIDKLKAVKFVKAAMGKRGLTAMPFSAGYIKVGDEVEIYQPQNFE